MYTIPDFKHKKDLKAAIQAGERVQVRPAAAHLGQVPRDGRVSIEGPQTGGHHTWYATVLMKDGLVLKVLA